MGFTRGHFVSRINGAFFPLIYNMPIGRLERLLRTRSGNHPENRCTPDFSLQVMSSLIFLRRCDRGCGVLDALLLIHSNSVFGTGVGLLTTNVHSRVYQRANGSDRQCQCRSGFPCSRFAIQTVPCHDDMINRLAVCTRSLLPLHIAAAQSFFFLSLWAIPSSKRERSNQPPRTFDPDPDAPTIRSIRCAKQMAELGTER